VHQHHQHPAAQFAPLAPTQGFDLLDDVGPVDLVILARGRRVSA
jgi:hypothetical protein